MKKIILSIIFLIFFSSIHSVYTAESIENRGSSYKLGFDTDQISLIEEYLITHKRKIELFAQKYEIKSNSEFNALFNDIWDMIYILKKIQENNIAPEKSKEILKKIVTKIKVTNDRLKVLLKNQKELFEKKLKWKKSSYVRLGTKVGSQLDKIIVSFAVSIKSKRLENSQKRIIIHHLIELEKYSKRLKNFKNVQFQNEKELKIWFIRILKDIKKEMIWIKESLKK